MTLVKLPIPYTIKVENQRLKTVKQESLGACDVREFEVPEYGVDDVIVVASWHQRWGRENYIGQQPLFSAEAGEWKKQFQAEPALSRVVMIDGKFYSPLKLAPRDGTATYLMTAENFESAMRLTDVYEMLSTTGEALTYFDKKSPFRQNLEKSGYLKDEGRPVLPSHKGKTRVSDNLEIVGEMVASYLSELAVVDGVVFGQIAEPVLVLRHNDADATLSVGSADRFASAESEMYFNINDYDIACDFLGEHFAGKFSLNVAAVQIDLPEAFGPSKEYDQVISAIPSFLNATRSDLPTYTEETGMAWYEIQALHAEKPLSEERIEAIVDHIEIMVTRLPQETVKYEDLTPKRVRLGAMIADRWRMRPVGAKPNAGV